MLSKAQRTLHFHVHHSNLNAVIDHLTILILWQAETSKEEPATV